MLSFLREWIQEIVVLLVLATFIDLALPSSSLKKYVDYAVGLILLLLLLSPIMRLMAQDIDISAMLAFSEQYAGRVVVTEPLSDNSSWLAYQLVLEERVRQLVQESEGVRSVNAQVTVDKNSASSSYGNPTDIVVEVKLAQRGLSQDQCDRLKTELECRLRTTYGLEKAQVRIYIE